MLLGVAVSFYMAFGFLTLTLSLVVREAASADGSPSLPLTIREALVAVLLWPLCLVRFVWRLIR